MNKEQIKNEIREAAEDLINGMKLISAMIEVEFPGCGHLVFDVLAEEAEKLRKRSEPEEGDTCQEGTGEFKRHCSAAPRKDMTLGNALDALKAGYRVARDGWNGKKQYIQLATAISYKPLTGGVVNCEHNDIGNKAIAFVGTSGVQMGWLASQADMLAEDWYIVE